MLWRMFGVVSLWVMVFLNLAQAQTNKEVEPNDTCKTAQDFSKSSLPFKVSGYAEYEPQIGNNDFYKLSGTPGELLEIYMQADFVPYVALANSQCVDLDQAAGGYLVFKVPGDGGFVVDAGSYYFRDSGNYTLSVKAVGRIDSIKGRVFDTVTRRPLTFAGHTLVRLFRCKNKQCFSLAGEKEVDGQGNFSFSEKKDGFPLGAGRYQLVAFSEQYKVGLSQEFTVAKGQAKQMNVAMESYPVRLAVVPCNNVPSTGGTCKFSVTVKNPQAKKLTANLWSLVEAFNMNALGQSTRFSLQAPKAISLLKGAEQTLEFSFNIPHGVRDGAQIFVTTYVGGAGPDMGFDIKGTSYFGIVKEAGQATLQAMPERDLSKHGQQLNRPLLAK